MTTSWKYEVHGTGDPMGHFVANGLRFGSKSEAEAYGRDLGMRWFGFDEGRAAESSDPVTSAWTGGMVVNIDAIPASAHRCEQCQKIISHEQHADGDGKCEECAHLSYGQWVQSFPNAE